MTKLTWLSHATWMIETGSHRILLDPFFTDNPAAKHSADDFDGVTAILLSHGHFDHMVDVQSIAKRCGCRVYTIFELAQWLGQNGVDDVTGMNIGGQVEADFGKIKMTPAVHSSSFPDGRYAGSPAGFLLTIEGKRIYFACDTAYFGDMKFYAHGADVAVLPIGDLYTMGVDDSINAVKLIEPKMVMPTHYATWPLIAQDGVAWARRVTEETGADAKAPKVGEAVEI